MDAEIALDVYNVLVGRRFRQGPLPDQDVQKAVMGQIMKIRDGEPIEILQYWGGCKNPNLPVERADLAEQATFENMGRLNSAVKELYSPGLKIHVVTGGARVERINGILPEKTTNYHNDIVNLSSEYEFMLNQKTSIFK